ncbi:MAG: YicC/YloC family endoribonuclease [Phycisphaerae bacterium]
MLHSMTGFGAAALETAESVWQLELRSVNNRYLKTQVVVPDDFTFLETDLEKQLRAQLVRGTVSLRLRYRALSEESAPQLNTAAIKEYMTQLANLVADDQQLTIDLATLALLPGVAQPTEFSEEQKETAARIATQLLATALEHLLHMRRAEGAALANDFLEHLRSMQSRLAVIRERSPHVVTEYRDRLLKRVNDLLAQSGVELAANDLLKEVSVFADRSDISEEIVRLEAHIVQFQRYMASSEPSGRKMEFIAQEMMREANTMGSKTGDAEISREIIEIKSTIDRIKEQVMNVE